MKHIVYIIPFLITFVSFSQDQKTSFTLQEAINYALENNRSVKNANLNIEAAKAQKWETTATGLPQIAAKVDYQHALKQQFDAIDFNGDGVADFGAKQSVNAYATLNQKIFDGSYLVGLQSAKVFLEISKNAKTKTDLEIRKAVIEAYGNVLLAQSSVSILERNLLVLEKNLFETTKIFENGLAEEESVEQLQITFIGVKGNLQNTLRLKDLAYKMLNITLGIDVETPIVLTDSLENLTVKNINLELLIADENIENNIDYKIAKNDSISKQLLLKLEKSKALPTLNAFINGGYIGNNNKFQFLTNNQVWTGTSMFGASLNIPIFSSGMRNAATQRAAINLEKATADLTETQQKLKLEISAAKSEYQYAVENYEIKKQNLNLAERIEKKNQTKFFEGISTSFDLRQAQTQLYTAQQEFLQGMLDVINKKAALETVLNTIPKN